MKPARFLLAPAVALVAVASCTSAPKTDPRMVSEWMHTLYGVVRAERISPPLASRLIGYASVALYEGLSAATPALPSMAGALNGLAELPRGAPGDQYDATMVAVEAERVLLDSLLGEALPTTQAALARLVDSLRNTRLAAGVKEPVRVRSEELGRRIGDAIVAWSRTDGFDSTRRMAAYVAPKGQGLWYNDAPSPIYTTQNLSGATQFVALDNPNNMLRSAGASDRGLILNRPKSEGLAYLPPVKMTGTTEPYWGTIRPLLLKTWDECAIDPPPVYDTTPGSPLYQDARAIYDMKQQLTEEQKMTALYWADNAGETATPAGHWTAIAAQMVSQRKLSAEDAARLFVLTSISTADAFIAGWAYKYKFSLLRPRTYIRAHIDPEWEPLIPTPPFPAYPSGHSALSAAAATVATALLGNVPFEDSTELSIGHPVRRFSTFDSAAVEAGASRLYGGIHFQIDNLGGQALGRCIGRLVVERPAAAAR
jgi:membrane-associated phospholipid phosphatase